MTARLVRTFALLVAVGFLAAQAATGFKAFEGAWFEVDYPQDFTARPSLQSDSADGADSAFFASPDGTVEFYVHSPQWGGVASDIALDPATERLADEKVVATGPLTKRWSTIAAKDGSYRRSYMTVTDSRGPSNWTIGRKYASQADLRRFDAEYLTFRESLRQFAD